jgi:ribosomal protein L37AE/L43A
LHVRTRQSGGQHEEDVMQVRSRKYADYIRARPAAPCAQCGKMLFGPEWSEYLSDRQVRHLWLCSSCNYEFETLVVFPPDTVRQREDQAA